VDELRQALGTSVEAPAKKVFRESTPQEERVQERIVTEDASTDELVYTDSSTFLKVGNCRNSLCYTTSKFTAVTMKLAI
jgi:hypothetical protein